MAYDLQIMTDDLADRFDAVDRASLAGNLRGLAECRCKGLRISAKMYQGFVVRAYLQRRAWRKKMRATE